MLGLLRPMRLRVNLGSSRRWWLAVFATGSALATLVACNGILNIAKPEVVEADAGSDAGVDDAAADAGADARDADADGGSVVVDAEADASFDAAPYDGGLAFSIPYTWDLAADYASQVPGRMRWVYSWSRWNAARSAFDRNLCFSPATFACEMVGWGLPGKDAPNVMSNPSDSFCVNPGVIMPGAFVATPSHEGAETEVDWYAPVSGLYTYDFEFSAAGTGSQTVRLTPGTFSSETPTHPAHATGTACLRACDPISAFVGTTTPSTEPFTNTTAIVATVTLIAPPNVINQCPATTGQVDPSRCAKPCTAASATAR